MPIETLNRVTLPTHSRMLIVGIDAKVNQDKDPSCLYLNPHHRLIRKSIGEQLQRKPFTEHPPVDRPIALHLSHTVQVLLDNQVIG